MVYSRYKLPFYVHRKSGFASQHASEKTLAKYNYIGEKVNCHQHFKSIFSTIQREFKRNFRTLQKHLFAFAMKKEKKIFPTYHSTLHY